MKPGQTPYLVDPLDQTETQLETEVIQFRSLPQRGLMGTVDTETHIIHGAAIATAGQPHGREFLFDEITLQQIVALGNTSKNGNGIKSRYTHPGLSSSGLGKFLGRVKGFQLSGKKAIGDLHLSAVAASSPEGDLRGYVEGLAVEDPDAFGMSMVVDLKRVWKTATGMEVPADKGKPSDAIGKLPFARVVKLHAVDAVDEPAANDGLFESLVGSNLAAHEAFAQIDHLIDYWQVDRERAYQLALSYFEARGLTLEGVNMDDELVLEAPVDAPPEVKTSTDWLRVQRENVIRSVLAAATDLPEQVRMKLSRRNFLSPDQLDAAIQEERETIAAVRKPYLDLPAAPPRGGLHIGQVVNEFDRLQGVMDWMFGVTGAPVPDYQFRRMDFLYTALTGDINFRGIFDPERVMFGGADTTTLAGLAVNAMNKVILEAWASLSFYRWYELVTSVEANDGSVMDMQWIGFGGVGDLPVVDEKQPYTELDVDDVKETDSFVKYGGYVGITLEMMKNSEIQRMQKIPRALAVAAARTRSAKLASIFTQASGVGPTLEQDSTALFHSNHSNVATTALGTDDTAWIAASTAMFNQTEVNSAKKLGFFAKYLLVPAALYFQALKIFGYGDGNPTSYNPFAIGEGGRLYTPDDPRPVPLAVPDFTDATDWAYLADPRVYPVLHMSYAQRPGGGGHPAPELFSVASPLAGLNFTNDLLPIKVRDWFAYGVSGWRGIGKRNVAG